MNATKDSNEDTDDQTPGHGEWKQGKRWDGVFKEWLTPRQWNSRNDPRNMNDG